jgi:hypothetical protein
MENRGETTVPNCAFRAFRSEYFYQYFHLRCIMGSQDFATYLLSLTGNDHRKMIYTGQKKNAIISLSTFKGLLSIVHCLSHQHILNCVGLTTANTEYTAKNTAKNHKFMVQFIL